MTAIPEPPQPPPETAERRLHPLSWLFVLLQQLKQFAFPLLVLIVTGRGDRRELWGLYAVAVLVLVSLARYFTYRYHIGADALTIRSGLLQKTLRQIPFERIQNVALQQSLLHRFFGVAEVRLESAGGAKPEAQMRVLKLADAQALEALIRQHGRHPAQAGQVDEPAQVLLQMDTAEVVRLGLVSNRGMLLLAGAYAASMQSGSNQVGRFIGTWSESLFGWTQSLHLSWTGYLLAGLSLFLVAAVFLRLLSVGWALLQFHGFVLSQHAGRLSLQRGLFTRSRANLTAQRIQSFSLSESLLHRWLHRQSLRVGTAVIESGHEKRSVRDLIPLATPERMQQLVVQLLSTAAWPIEQWQPLHPRAWRRQFTVPALLALLACAALAWRFGPLGFLALAALPLLYLRARVWAHYAGYAEQAGLIAVREGWLDRHWRFALVRKLQGIELTQSPFDRRHGMATLHLDTAGAGIGELPLRIRYLPLAQAQQLYARLAAAIDRAPGITPARTAASAAPAP